MTFRPSIPDEHKVAVWVAVLGAAAGAFVTGVMSICAEELRARRERRARDAARREEASR